MQEWNSLEVVNSQIAADRFNRLNRQARLEILWSCLIGRPGTLLSYEDMNFPSRAFIHVDRGVREIPIRSIVGSVSRAKDYDRNFRPLNPALKDRWINVYVLNEEGGWEPIIVWKVGALYFVEDGHRRVSIARHSGWDYIQADVYE